MRRCLIAVLLAFTGMLQAAPLPFDHEPKLPYDWRIFVKLKPNPKFNTIFRTQFVKDLKAALTPLLGDELGVVTILELASIANEKREPIVQRFEDVGWSALGLDDFRTLTGLKSHFLTVEYANGRFLLESGQHDGSTGLSTPQIRKQTVIDPETLTRTAGLMLAADFGPVGTIEAIVDNKDFCLLRLRGLELPGIERFLRKGDVFALSLVFDTPRPQSKPAKIEKLKPGQVIETPLDRKTRPRPGTLLRVTEVIRSGLAKCEIFSINDPFPKMQRLVGYRALKLSTYDGPVQVQVMEAQTRKLPTPNIPLEVWATEYGGLVTKPNPRDSLELRKGLFSSGRNMRGLAYVWVKLGNEQVPFLVPILTAGGPADIPFQFDESAVRKARFQDRVERFNNRVFDTRLAQDQLGLGLRTLIEKAENKKALERAERGLKALVENDKTLTDELEALRKDANAKDERIARDLNTAEQLIASMRVVKPELEAKVVDLQLSLEKADNPAEYEKKFRANELTRLIAFHERRGEVPEALEQYDRLIELTQLDEARMRKAKLEAEGKPKTPEIEALRNQVRIDWNSYDKLDTIKPVATKLGQDVEALGKAADRYGLRMAQTSIQGSYTKLGELLNSLDGELIQDQEQIKAIAIVKGELQKIDEAIAAHRKRLGD